MATDDTSLPPRRGRRRRASWSGRRALGAALAVVAVAAGATALRPGPGSVTSRVVPGPTPSTPSTAPTTPAAPSASSSASSTAAPTALSTALATSLPPAPSRASSRASSRERAGTRLTGVYVTAYTWFDNTPPGSSAVSHPKVHRRAGGSGTYDDPVTVAVGHDRSTGRDVLDVPAGTRFYLPYLQRYLVVEDTCGDGPAPQDGPCHDLSQAPPGTTLWLDVWIGGAGGDPDAVAACAEQVTGAGGRTALRDPPRGLPVTPGPLYAGGCALP